MKKLYERSRYVLAWRQSEKRSWTSIEDVVATVEGLDRLKTTITYRKTEYNIKGEHRITRHDEAEYLEGIY